jgi:phage protein D/phage baseplate assembly protein gpV
MTTKIAGVEIRVGGSPIDPKYAARLAEIQIDDNLVLPDAFVIRFHDPGLENVDSSLLEIGADVEILLEAPDDNQLNSVIQGEIASVEPEFGRGGVLLTARGYDYSHKLFRTERAETYQNMTYGDIARKVINRGGLQPGTVDTNGAVHDFVQQSAETDWEFLWRLARTIDFEVVGEQRKVHFRPAGGGSGGDPITLKWGQNLHTFRPRATGVQQVKDVVVRGWDPKRKQKIEETAKPRTLGSTIGISHDDASSGLGGGTVVVADRPTLTNDEAGALAESVVSHLSHAWLHAEGSCQGNPRLRAGARVQIDGVGSRFGGTYSLTSTKHLYRGGKGYETTFKTAGRSSGSLIDLIAGGGARQAAKLYGVVIGIVTNNDDPEELGRVRVKFPWLDDHVESWWARIASAGAGAGRGMLMLPQVDDEVLVAFEHGDVRFPYVIGALWNGADKPDQVVKQDGTFVVHSHRQIELEAQEDITIKSAQDFNVQTDGKITEKASGGFTVEGQTVTVKAQSSASIEAGSELTVKAPSLTVEAQGSLTLKSSGVVRISGSQIMLG